jgi:hypothetical protein
LWPSHSRSTSGIRTGRAGRRHLVGFVLGCIPVIGAVVVVVLACGVVGGKPFIGGDKLLRL